jgi:uncharacterized protein (TIGR00369 family)
MTDEIPPNLKTFIETFAGAPDTLEAWSEGFEKMKDQTAMGVHDFSLVDVGEDHLTLEMPMGDHARQVAGILHGGISMVLAETAASMHACWGIDLTERMPVGIEINGTHLASATDGTIRARAEVLNRGYKIIQHRIEIRHVERDEVLCESRVTNYYRSAP